MQLILEDIWRAKKKWAWDSYCWLFLGSILEFHVARERGQRQKPGALLSGLAWIQNLLRKLTGKIELLSSLKPLWMPLSYVPCFDLFLIGSSHTGTSDSWHTEEEEPWQWCSGKKEFLACQSRRIYSYSLERSLDGSHCIIVYDMKASRKLSPPSLPSQERGRLPEPSKQEQERKLSDTSDRLLDAGLANTSTCDFRFFYLQIW